MIFLCVSIFSITLTVRPAFSDIWCGRRSVGVASWPLLPSHFGWHLFCRWMAIFRDAGSWKVGDAHFDVPWIWWFHGSHWSGSKQLRLGLELDITWSILIHLDPISTALDNSDQFWCSWGKALAALGYKKVNLITFNGLRHQLSTLQFEDIMDFYRQLLPQRLEEPCPVVSKLGKWKILAGRRALDWFPLMDWWRVKVPDCPCKSGPQSEKDIWFAIGCNWNKSDHVVFILFPVKSLRIPRPTGCIVWMHDASIAGDVDEHILVGRLGYSALFCNV